MDFAEEYELYKQNVVPAMLEVLATDLGCGIKSLQQLGVGFYPAKQSWVFAERDSNGEIIGLALRGLNGKKFMVEGSKRGLVYPYNEDHIEGDHKYDPGRCHWVRISDAGVDCPICGKQGLSNTPSPTSPTAVCKSTGLPTPGNGY